ncbi:MAG: DUF819 family protein [Spirochaetales bacterium]|jgi:uncharacterized membrane protein
MTSTLLICFVVFFPALALFAKERVSLFSKWSPLIVCYVAGLVIGNIGILPESALGLLDTLSTAAVAFSLPLLLFSVDIRKWKELSGKAILAFALAAFSVGLVATITHFLFAPKAAESWKVAGMLVGLYTGGTPNLAAIKTALNVDRNIYIAVHTSDMVISALYLLAVMTIAKPLFSRFLPTKDWNSGIAMADGVGEEASLTKFFAKNVRRRLPIALGITAIIVAISLGFSMLFPADFQTMIVILVITTLSLAASLLPSVRAIPMTFPAGEYILYSFCIAVGAMGNFSMLLTSAPTYFIYVAIVLFGSFFLHALLCAIFRIDVDTMLIVSTSAICSPPFVGVVAVAIKARKLIVPGITTGIIGYALGNYLGIALAELIHTISG